jgi:translation elongation factor aEF-1 beta
MYKMGDVVGLIRIMPTGILKDDELNQMMEKIKTLVKSPARVGNIEIKNVAFGLRGINLTVVIPDKAGQGGLDPIAEEISKIKDVETAEVTDVGLL